VYDYAADNPFRNFHGFEGKTPRLLKYLKPKLSNLLRELFREDASGFAKTSGIPANMSWVFAAPCCAKWPVRVE